MSQSRMPECRDDFKHARYQMTGTAACDRCGAAIEWWRTTRGKKLAVLAPKPDDDIFTLTIAHYPNRCPGVVVKLPEPTALCDMDEDAAIAMLLSKDPDSYTVQLCCLAYGGSSFTDPMQRALETHLSILRSRLKAMMEVTR